MTSYVVTVVRDTLFGRHEARWVVRVEPDHMSFADQISGMAALITDGDWSCRPLTEKEALRDAQ